MKLYVGLDVGLEETSLCIVDSEGLTEREVKINTEPEAIRFALESHADRLDRVGVEASSLGIWLYREAGRGPDHCCRSAPYACLAVDDAQ
jgi:transposase